MSRLVASQRAWLAPNWVREDLSRKAQALPSLDLRFAESKSLTDAASGQSLVTFTRASSGTYVGSDGVLKTATTNEPRFDHSPTTGESLGLLVEEQRTNLLLNSGTLSTQNVTVTAVAHTLSFTGTGTITLSGTSTAGPLVGTGTGEANRVSLTFTPTAGTLTLTVSGSVTNAQLEAGSFRTSYIPTTTATATRSADVASITGTNFSSWYRQDEGTVFASVRQPQIYGCHIVGLGTGSGAIYQATNNAEWWNGSTLLTTSNTATWPNGANVVGSYTSTDRYLCLNAGTVATSATTLVNGGSMRIGANFNSSGFCNGTIRRLCYWGQRLPNSTLQQITQ